MPSKKKQQLQKSSPGPGDQRKEAQSEKIQPLGFFSWLLIQYELATALYILEPWEKVIFSTETILSSLDVLRLRCTRRSSLVRDVSVQSTEALASNTMKHKLSNLVFKRKKRQVTSHVLQDTCQCARFGASTDTCGISFLEFRRVESLAPQSLSC
jgi:hypothetical protein